MALAPEHARRLVRRSGPVLLAGLLWLPACGSTATTSTAPTSTTTAAPGGGMPGTSSPAPGGSTPTGSATTDLAPPGALTGADTGKKEHAATGNASAVSHLTALRVARQDGFDRVVFEFDGDIPGYAVAYVDGPIVEDPSGRTVTVAGSGHLRVRFDRASAAALDRPGGGTTYPGPNRVTGDAAKVKEVVSVGDFEAVMTWVIGVDGKRPNLVTTLTSPSRVIVDIATT